MANNKRRSGARQPLVADDGLEIPDFLRRKGDAKSVAANNRAWDKFMASKRPDGQTQDIKVNWMKPRSLSEEEFNAFQEAEERRKAAKENKKKIVKTTKVNTVGKRWVPDRGIWVDDATGAPALTAKEETKAMREAVKAANKEKREKLKAERKAKAAVPATGILAEFSCRPDTNRANLLVTFEKNLGKMLSAATLVKAVYGPNADVKAKLGPLIMVILGANVTIAKSKLPYELKAKEKAAWGLFKKGKKTK